MVGFNILGRWFSDKNCLLHFCFEPNTIYTSRKLTCPLRRDHLSRENVFQSFFFSGDMLVFRGVHPRRLTWNIIMEVWKIIFLSKWVICRFYVNLPGCKENTAVFNMVMNSLENHPFAHARKTSKSQDPSLWTKNTRKSLRIAIPAQGGEKTKGV